MPTPPRRRPTTLRTEFPGEIESPGAPPRLSATEARLSENIPAGAVKSPIRERFIPRPPKHWRPWFWLAALLLHVLIIGALLLLVHQRPMQQAFEPTGVSVVFSPGEPNPSAPRPSPIPTPAQAPPPAAPPPPPPQQAEEQPEVNLNIPDDALSMPDFVPQPNTQPAPPAQAARATSHATRQTHAQKYIVMNHMSYSNSSTQAPPSAFANKALNLDAGGADENLANTAQISIQGDPGTNWDAIFNKWVNEHTYYPQAAAEQGQQGSSTISFTVHRDGTVTGVRLLSSAGSPFLDQAWLGIFLQNNVPPFSPDAKDNSVHIVATLNYELEP